ncbi:PH domain-containing protein [Actinoplanes friuliensis]|uniref:SHOCT domain-containing protein n=1 Tax=Actinoplanes friuliensis DSM 7358 TaxID=1246995 RepID=U5W5K0_9ACTN|nr:PH domain-containing protein [Actinoplanes friuliensis]AGZ43196.1 hypothetical protein AFR_24650 [Actinoplanes friuliensis DSM 7358]
MDDFLQVGLGSYRLRLYPQDRQCWEDFVILGDTFLITLPEVHNMADTPLRPDIAAAKAQMPSSLGTGREVKNLEGYLWEGETVERMVGGQYGKGTGLLVVTDRRLLFVVHGMMSQQSEDFPIERISSIQWSAGMVLGAITIFASGNKAEIKNVEKNAGKALVDMVRDRVNSKGAFSAGPIAAPPAPAPTSAPAAPAASSATEKEDIIDRIRRLGELHASGILTDEEFTSKKTDLLGRL